MYAGPKTLGSTVLLKVQARNGDVPTAAAGAVSFKVFSEDGTTLITGTCTSFVATGITAVYDLSFVASTANGFVRGASYHVVAYYTVGSNPQQDWWTFNVV
jgi:hypothetical protein